MCVRVCEERERVQVFKVCTCVNGSAVPLCVALCVCMYTSVLNMGDGL